MDRASEYDLILLGNLRIAGITGTKGGSPQILVQEGVRDNTQLTPCIAVSTPVVIVRGFRFVKFQQLFQLKPTESASANGDDPIDYLNNNIFVYAAASLSSLTVTGPSLETPIMSSCSNQ
jgi:hypothetical protein